MTLEEETEVMELLALVAAADVLFQTVHEKSPGQTEALRDTANPYLNDHLGKELKTNA